MSLILNGTTGLSDVDGSAATPAIRGTDANTGIFFPAADTIAFATAGTEDFRIGSAGELGIQGANYGTSGQVLTSGGSGAAPTWTTPSGTATGTIIGYGSATPPSGFLACDGSTYNDASYTALSTVLGNIRSNVFTSSLSSAFFGTNVALTNSRIFILQDNTTTASYFSSDSGATWSTTNVALRGNVVWNGTYYVAGFGSDCSANGIRYSTNGTSWTTVTANINWGVSGIAWSGSRYVAVQENGGNNSYSTNGTTWTAGGAFGGSANFMDVAFGASLFVAVGGLGSTPRIATSTDGTAWTSRTVPAGWGTNGAKSVIFINSRFVAVDANNNIISSTDGITWTLNYTNNVSSSVFFSQTAGNRQRVSYNSSDSSYYFQDAYSSDLATWSKIPRSASYSSYVVSYSLMSATVSDGTRVYNGNGFVYNPYPYTTGSQFLVPNLQTVNSAGVFYHIKT
jgi:hypothetical protein